MAESASSVMHRMDAASSRLSRLRVLKAALAAAWWAGATRGWDAGVADATTDRQLSLTNPYDHA